ncbi:MAG TPA: FAD:protein FMN transferase [Candidatus Mediterraneibacter surreyensis]|nr:FAD:protein FMN transferase [Candidatus Mediterraneibacter surreyensis]
MVVTLNGCTVPPKSESLTMTGTYFDTVVQIEVWGADQEIMEHCRQMCEDYEQMLSATIETSEISRINNAGGEPVEVSDETAGLIEEGIKYGDISDGQFDITIASATDLWNFTDNEEKILPDPDELAEAVTHIDYHCIKVEGNTVTLTDPEARIDLGGIAKGYIADRLKEYLKDEGIEHALIDLGGNMLTLGRRYDGNDFRIGIQKPFADTGTAMAVVSVNDKSVVTSGDYERYFEKDGVIYHHILDPDTGYPVQNDLDQVTIISDQSVDGDALSTTCFAMGLEDGLELIRSLDGIEAVFVTKDGEMHTSSNEIELEVLK